jgi:hypothetical protein
MPLINIKSKFLRWLFIGVICLAVNILGDYFFDGSPIQTKQVIKDSAIVVLILIVIALVGGSSKTAGKNAS